MIRLNMTGKCMICGSKELVVYNSVDVEVCKKCSFGRRINIPPKIELKKIYKKDYFSDKNGVEYYKDALHRFKYLNRYFFKGARILDFGCGMGQFANLCKINGFDVTGYDVSEYAAKYLAEVDKIPTISGHLTQDLFKKNTFDFIVTFDVVEHIVDFEKVLGYFRYWLKTPGILIITTPNTCSWDSKFLGEKWESYQKVPEHIYFFSPMSLKMTLNNIGFSNVRVNDWGFVRSINFVMEKKLWGNSEIIKFIRKIIKKSKVGDIFIYFKMHNMMVIAKKT